MKSITSKDRRILRELAKLKRDRVESVENQQRREDWYRLDDSTQDSRPMLLAEFAGVNDVEKPFNPDALECESELARTIEQGFRWMFFIFDNLKDDHVFEPVINIPWKVKVSDFGVEVISHKVEIDGLMGAINWEPPIKDIDRDFDKLKHRSYSVDREATLREKAILEEVFDGILDIGIRCNYWWTLGMTGQAIKLIGMENLMMYMFDNPQGLHRLMAFLHDDILAYSKWLEDEGLLTLNNQDDYIGSGSLGYSRALPASGAPVGGPVRRKDQWALLESQETVGVGPDQFEEFVFPYQKDIAEYFGRIYYGCCEPVNTRWHVIEKLENLQRVSVSPWCDQAFMGEVLGRRYVFSRKPNPTLISTEVWDEDAIRADLQSTLKSATGCRLEIIMKDVHTLNNEPWRISRWVEIAREEIARHF